MDRPLAIITGGTKGIGLACIDKFLLEGFDVVTCSRQGSELKSLQDEIRSKYGSERIFVYQADLSKKTEVIGFVSFIKKLLRPVDVLINNTGRFIPGQIHNEPDGNLEIQIETNLYSAYHLSRGLVDDMIRRKRGHIFNMCSIASFMAYSNGGSYAISKFAMLGMSKCLREELKEYQIRVTSILPGATLTASWEGIELPPDRLMRAEDVAESVWSAFKLSERSVVEEIVIRPQLGDL
jgi:short-subunit dehydrogenase